MDYSHQHNCPEPEYAHMEDQKLTIPDGGQHLPSKKDGGKSLLIDHLKCKSIHYIRADTVKTLPFDKMYKLKIFKMDIFRIPIVVSRSKSKITYCILIYK